MYQVKNLVDSVVNSVYTDIPVVTQDKNYLNKNYVVLKTLLLSFGLIHSIADIKWIVEKYFTYLLPSLMKYFST